MPDVGELIDEKYRLVRQLGQGGMGAVYEAVHEQIGKSVAVKVLLPQGAEEQELIARFHQEAQAASAAGHRGIVDIYDVGVCPDGAPYLVMEMLVGESLSERLAREAEHRLKVPEAAYIVCQVLSALSAAHQAGVVHRDLKPENIYLADSGAPLPEVKLLDFGISRVIAPNGPDAATRMTRSGVVMGTPQYMSPEQAAGKKDIDHRTDLYSMAVILQQCLTSELPHNADNYNALMASIIADPPRSPELSAVAIAPELAQVIARGLAKRPAERYADAAQMFYEVRPFVDSSVVGALRAPIAAAAPSIVASESREPPPTQRSSKTAATVPSGRRGGDLGTAQTQAAPATEQPTTAAPVSSDAAMKRSPPWATPPTVRVEAEKGSRRWLIALVVVVILGAATGGVFFATSGSSPSTPQRSLDHGAAVGGGGVSSGSATPTPAVEPPIEPASGADPIAPPATNGEAVSGERRAVEPDAEQPRAAVREAPRAAPASSPERPVDQADASTSSDYGTEIRETRPRPSKRPRVEQERDYGTELD